MFFFSLTFYDYWYQHFLHDRIQIDANTQLSNTECHLYLYSICTSNYKII